MLTMTVPGLLRQAGSFADARSAQSLARYVDASVQERDGLETALCVALSLERGTPVAPLCALGAGLAVDDRYTLAATPVTLVADRDVVVLVGAVSDLQVDEAATLIDILNRHFAGDGVTFAAPRPSTWFAQCDRSFTLSTSPMDSAVTHPIAPFLPTGPDANIWQRWQVEIQMLFHEHAVNAARAERGLAAVSGVWLSGNGRLADTGHPTFRNVFASRDPYGDLARGLARHAGLLADTLPTTFAEMIQSSKRSREAISTTRALRGSNDQFDGDVLVAMNAISSASDVARFDTDWLKPAVDALASGQLDALQLIADGHGAAVTWHAKRPSGLARMTLPLKRRRLQIPAIAQE